MFVVKRNGKKESVQFDKITARINKLCYGLSDKIQPILVAQKVSRSDGRKTCYARHSRRAGIDKSILRTGMWGYFPRRDHGRARRPRGGDGGVHVDRWVQCCPVAVASRGGAGGLDGGSSLMAFALPTDYPEYSQLAARIAVSNLHKQTKKSFIQVMTDLRAYINPKTGKKAPLISEHGVSNQPVH